MDSRSLHFPNFAVLATGVYLRRNDAFLSGCVYLLAGAIGAPVFAEGGDALFSGGALIASGGYLLAFPLASALVAEGLDRSRTAGIADFKAQLICWFTAMIPVYLIGTLWLAEAYSVDFAQAFEWGVEPFLIWDAAKIVVMAIITTKFGLTAMTTYDLRLFSLNSHKTGSMNDWVYT